MTSLWFVPVYEKLALIFWDYESSKEEVLTLKPLEAIFWVAENNMDILITRKCFTNGWKRKRSGEVYRKAYYVKQN